MKTIFKITLVAFMLLTGAMCASAQVFSKMTDGQRNAALIKIAKRLYRADVFDHYYKMYGYNGKAKISSHKVENSSKSALTYGHDVGQLQYIVKLYCRPTKELGSYTAVKVIISDKTGKPWYIKFDCDGIIYTPWDTPEAFEKFNY